MSLISKDNSNILLQGIKKLLDLKANKSEVMQSDWEQNDSAKNSYIKNRPFYEEINTTDISGTSYIISGLTYEEPTKVLDEPIPLELGQVWECTREHRDAGWVSWLTFEVQQADDGTLFLGVPVNEDGTIVENNLVSIYLTQNEFAADPSIIRSGYHSFKFTCIYGVVTDKTIKQIEEKYLPDSVFVQPDWNQNDPNGDGYIKNRIAYSDLKTYEMNNFDGIQAGYYFYHVSDDIPTYEFILSAKNLKIIYDGSLYTNLGIINNDNFIAIYIKDFYDIEPTYIANYSIIIAKNSNSTFLDQEFTNTGVYFFKDLEYNDKIDYFAIDIDSKTLPLELFPLDEIQANWNERNNSSLSFIKNKPDVALKSDVKNINNIVTEQALLINDSNIKIPLIYNGHLYFYNGIFIFNSIASISDYNCIYSNDGIYWRKIRMPSNSKIIYADDKFVGLKYNTNSIVYSTDYGVSWTTINLSDNTYTPDSINDITYGNGRFIATSSMGFWHSLDAINWSFVSTYINGISYWSKIEYGNGRFVAITTFGDFSKIYSSVDGINWIYAYKINTHNSPSLRFKNDRFFLLNGIIKSSYDGIDWTDITMPSSQAWKDIAYGNNKFVAVASDNIAAYSEDGINWIETQCPINGRLEIAYGNDKFVIIDAANPAGYNFAYSSDGINWSQTYKEITLNKYNFFEGINNIIHPKTDPTLSLIGTAADAKATSDAIMKYVYSPKSHFVLIDDINSCEYIIRMQDGTLTSTCKASSIAVTTKPNKISYNVNDTFDITGMVVTLTRQDGSTEEINNYNYTQPNLSVAGSTVYVEVSYVEAGETYIDKFKVSVTEDSTA